MRGSRIFGHTVKNKTFMENKISLTSGDLRLKAGLRELSADRAVVITHPHPQYGGNMDNAVVNIIADAYSELGWSTLRFNFRGVADSQGQFDRGIGEQDDLQAAVTYLSDKGFTQIDLAGYSFGAWIIALWAQRAAAKVHRIFLVAPPVAFLDFSTVGAIDGLSGVFAGTRDDFAPTGTIKALLPTWKPDLALGVIPHADHFFSYHGDALKQTLAAAIAK